MPPILIPLLFAGSVFFFVQWFLIRSQQKQMTTVEKFRATVAQAEALNAARARGRTGRVWPWQRAADWVTDTAFTKLGWKGPLGPLVFAWFGLYLVLAFALNLVGAPTGVAGLLGVVASFAVIRLVLSRVEQRRRKLFNRQLMRALELAAARLEGGAGPEAALRGVAEVLDNPLRQEFLTALTRIGPNFGLVDSFAELATRFPSRAMTMLVAALRIDAEVGGRIAPALRSASTSLQTNFELADEATAELAQQRMEFWGILGVIGFMTGSAVVNSGDQGGAAILSPIGLLALALGVGNLLFGVHRCLKMFRVAESRT